MDLVEHSCQVWVNPADGATFWHVEGDEFELWDDTCDADMRDMLDSLRDANPCGKPASDYVDMVAVGGGDDRVWMCPEHYCQYLEGIGS